MVIEARERFLRAFEKYVGPGRRNESQLREERVILGNLAAAALAEHLTECPCSRRSESAPVVTGAGQCSPNQSDLGEPSDEEIRAVARAIAEAYNPMGVEGNWLTFTRHAEKAIKALDAYRAKRA